MSKRMMLIASMAISAAVLSVPSLASAQDKALHIIPKPFDSTVQGGAMVFSSTNGNTWTCGKVHGVLKWTSTTGGTLNLTFSEGCSSHVGAFTVGCSSISTGT